MTEPVYDVPITTLVGEPYNFSFATTLVSEAEAVYAEWRGACDAQIARHVTVRFGTPTDHAGHQALKQLSQVLLTELIGWLRFTGLWCCRAGCREGSPGWREIDAWLYTFYFDPRGPDGAAVWCGGAQLALPVATTRHLLKVLDPTAPPQEKTP